MPIARSCSICSMDWNVDVIVTCVPPPSRGVRAKRAVIVGITALGAPRAEGITPAW